LGEEVEKGGAHRKGYFTGGGSGRARRHSLSAKSARCRNVLRLQLAVGVVDLEGGDVIREFTDHKQMGRFGVTDGVEDSMSGTESGGCLDDLQFLDRAAAVDVVDPDHISSKVGNNDVFPGWVHDGLMRVGPLLTVRDGARLVEFVGEFLAVGETAGPICCEGIYSSTRAGS